MNYVGVAKYLGLGLFLIVLLSFIPGVHAENTTANSSYVIVDIPGITYDTTINPPRQTYRVTQGQTVYVNDTIDISGMGWGTGVAWYGRYGEYEEAQYVRDFTGLRRDVQNFYLDPKIFAIRDGMWYQYYEDQDYSERRGNLEAFYVKTGERLNTITYSNGTVVNQTTMLHGVEVDRELPPEVIVPEIRISDYLLALGDPLNTTFPKAWVFGRVDGIYNHTGNLTIEDVGGLEVGRYKLVSHSSGNNTIFEVGYSDNKFTSPWKGIDDQSVYGSQPMLDINKFYWMITSTDDKIQTFDMEVQEPTISIISIDEVDVGNRVPIKWQPGLTLLDVRGYTNTQNGTTLTFILDPDTHNAREIKDVTFNTTARRTSPGNMSYYRIFIPVNKNNMPNGMHTLRASTEIGGSMFYDFPISELPADSYVPNATIKYIGDRNPWKPNMTIPDPIVVVQTKVIERVITVEITPSTELILAQQQIAQKERVDYWVSMGIVAVIGLIILVFGGWYVITVIRRL